jgi:hypothetical protein
MAEITDERENAIMAGTAIGATAAETLSIGLCASLLMATNMAASPAKSKASAEQLHAVLASPFTIAMIMLFALVPY